jgi:zinc D-Ala-D-Ala carboxypeptidase
MKFSRINVSAIVIASAALFALALFISTAGHGQSPVTANTSENNRKSLVKPTLLIIDSRGNSIVNSAALESAASANSTLSSELTWTFGGKEQRGWYLYSLLMKRLLNSDEEPYSKGFALALARWQESSGAKPTGVLDEESFMSMVSKWQAARIKNRELAQPDQLVTVSATEFYDPERLEELRQVEKETYAAYKRLLAAAIAEPSLRLGHDAGGKLSSSEKYLKLISTFRSREYQEKLRRESPNAGRAGLAVNSPHFTGRALDLYVGGDPVDTKDSNRALQVQTPVYRWLVRNAERFGFRPYFYEPWHWEYVGERQ